MKRAVRQPRLFLSPPWVDEAERRAVMRAFDSGYVAPCGPQVDEFERRLARLAGRRYAVAVSSGTAALDLLMAEFAVGPETTVIAPALTFIATVGPAWHRGAKIVFIDSDATGNVDLGLLERAFARHRGERTLFLGVDLYGRCLDYAAVSRLCRRYRVTFLCDSAEAVGATSRGRAAGSGGRAAVYSFNGNKIITTSGGGAILTDDAGLAARARKRSQQSREPVAWYEHREVGYNYRLSNLLASVGLSQLRKLPAILKRRAANHRFYARFFDGVRDVRAGRGAAELLPAVAGENYWLTVALMESPAARDRTLAALTAAGIEARPVWKPLHLQPVFRGCEFWGGKVAETLFRRGLCLPSGSGLTAAERRRVVEVIAAAQREISPKPGETRGLIASR